MNLDTDLILSRIFKVIYKARKCFAWTDDEDEVLAKLVICYTYFISRSLSCD